MTRIDPKKIVICADDFGLTESACISILELCSIGAISAVSCAVDGAFFDKYINDLLTFKNHISLGLHFNLTENIHINPPINIKSLIIKNYIRQLDAELCKYEIDRQLNKFEKFVQDKPEFLDGHEHVHQFSIVSKNVLDHIVKRYGRCVAVRSTVPCAYRGLKAEVIACLGGYALRNKLKSLQLPHNADFAGVYDFTTRVPYKKRMQRWIKQIDDLGLIMCHPENAQNNNHSSARLEEHCFFHSAEWEELKLKNNVQLIKFKADSLVF